MDEENMKSSSPSRREGLVTSSASSILQCLLLATPSPHERKRKNEAMLKKRLNDLASAKKPSSTPKVADKPVVIYGEKASARGPTACPSPDSHPVPPKRSKRGKRSPRGRAKAKAKSDEFHVSSTVTQDNSPEDSDEPKTEHESCSEAVASTSTETHARASDETPRKPDVKFCLKDDDSRAASPELSQRQQLKRKEKRQSHVESASPDSSSDVVQKKTYWEVVFFDTMAQLDAPRSTTMRPNVPSLPPLDNWPQCSQQLSEDLEEVSVDSLLHGTLLSPFPLCLLEDMDVFDDTDLMNLF